jgi:hypothetical protein
MTHSRNTKRCPKPERRNRYGWAADPGRRSLDGYSVVVHSTGIQERDGRASSSTRATIASPGSS